MISRFSCRRPQFVLLLSVLLLLDQIYIMHQRQCATQVTPRPGVTAASAASGTKKWTLPELSIAILLCFIGYCGVMPVRRVCVRVACHDVARLNRVASHRGAV